MKTAQRFALAILGTVVPAFLFTPVCTAQCAVGSHPRAAHTSLFLRPGEIRLLPAALLQDDAANLSWPSIVGFWHQKLIVAAPGGATDVIDDDLAQWHGDHTEIQNTQSRSPISGDFYLGVWEQTGRYTYKLNHFPLAWDSTGTTFIGPANLREEVTVSPDGNHYRGHFTLYQYDSTGKKLPGGAEGVVTGTRITPDSTPESIF